MNEKLYDLMDWAKIEAIVFSEEDEPQTILGPHVTEEGILIQCFFPGASAVTVQVERTGKLHTMEMQDEAGFFAVLLKGKRISAYHYLVSYGEEEIIRYDPYAFSDCISEREIKDFEQGINYHIYDKLGAHPMEIDGVKGVLFAVWAPNAMRVSVVGDFNLWDGRVYQMKRLYGRGVYELFIPGIEQGMIYKYEIKTKAGLPILKADPYEFYSEFRPANASVVWDIENYQWKDKKWLDDRKKKDFKKEPMSIYEVHLGSWKKPEKFDGEEDDAFYNYREIAPLLASYVKKMNYTHIELMPIMEHPFDGSWGYQVTGYFAATSRYGTPDDFMYFMDYMHQKGIGVILDWVPAHFPRDAFALADFDGTCLYEHADPRQGAHPHWGTLIFNYGRPEVSNFLIANALFWVEKYHADGIRMDAVASMLYLDYGKEAGEWIPNKDGGKENLEAIELLKHLNSAFKKQKNGAVIIAEESTSWPMVTGSQEDGGLGFDMKWNMGWMNDFLNYMKTDPLFRKGNHGLLTFSMMYAYSEDFILVLSHDEVVHGKASMIGKMPGDMEQKFANLRTAYGFMTTHPGKKLLFMGQEFAQFAEWSEKKSLDWNLVEEHDSHKNMQNYVKALNHLYQSHNALYELDNEPEGFEWIDCSDAERSIVTFLRKTKKKEETLLIICNFTPVVREEYQIGVPFKGKYKEIFNSDSKEFGGQNNCNSRVKVSKSMECHGREESIRITAPPLGIAVFTCTPEEEKKTAKRKKTAGKTAVKKNKTEKTETEVIETKETETNGKGKRGKTKKAEAEEKKTETKKVTRTKKEPAKKETVSETKQDETISKNAEGFVKEEVIETTAKKQEKLETKAGKTEKIETAAKKPEQIETKAGKTEKIETAAKKPEQIETKAGKTEKIETTAKKPEQIETKAGKDKKIETTAKKPEQIETKAGKAKKIETAAKKPEQIETKAGKAKKIETTAKKPEQIETKAGKTEKIETTAKKPEQIETKAEKTEKIETTAKKAKKIGTSAKKVKQTEIKAEETKQIEVKAVKTEELEPAEIEAKDLEVKEIKAAKTTKAAKAAKANEIEKEKEAASEDKPVKKKTNKSKETKEKKTVKKGTKTAKGE